MQSRNKQGQTEAEFLKAYDANKYERPSVTADIAVFTLDRTQKPAVLLIKRSDHPFIGKWALPGGFVNMDEDLKSAAERELLEETGVKGTELLQFGAFGAPDRDPRTRIITVGFMALLPVEDLKLAAGDDAAEAGLFNIYVKREQTGAEAYNYIITLTGNASLCASVNVQMQNGIGYVAQHTEGDLATDHARLLFCALNALKALPRLFVSDNICKAQNRAAARVALNKLFDVFPSFISV